MKFRKNFIGFLVMAFLGIPSFSFSGTQWSSALDMPVARYGLGSEAVNGKIYVISGNVDGGRTGSVLAYDPQTNAYATVAPIPVARGAFASGVIDGKIYVCGGHSGSQTNRVDEYNPQANTWTQKASLPAAMDNPVGAVVNGKLYVIGGCCGFRNTIYEYDPAGNVWSTKTPMPTARCAMTAAVADGIIYVFGGHNNYSPSNYALAKVEAFNPATNAWTAKGRHARSGQLCPKHRHGWEDLHFRRDESQKLKWRRPA